MILVVQASSGGDLIESFAEPHLSDPFWAKRAGCSDVSAKPLNGWCSQSVTPRWLPSPKDNGARLCVSASPKLRANKNVSVSVRRTKPEYW